MNDSSQSVRVSIFGDDYSVKGDVNIETTRTIAEYVDRKMMEIRQNSASNDKLKIAILSALNITGELFELRSRYETCEKSVRECERRIESLTQRIQQAL